MSQEDRKFETNKRFVRFARNAVKRASEADPDAPPVEQAKRAVLEAAKQDAPGLVTAAQAIATGSDASAGLHHHKRSGRWTREGKNIVLYGG